MIDTIQYFAYSIERCRAQNGKVHENRMNIMRIQFVNATASLLQVAE